MKRWVGNFPRKKGMFRAKNVAHNKSPHFLFNYKQSVCIIYLKIMECVYHPVPPFFFIFLSPSICFLLILLFVHVRTYKGVYSNHEWGKRVCYLPYWLGIISGLVSSVSWKPFGSPPVPTSRTTLVSLIGVDVRLLCEWWFRPFIPPCIMVVGPMQSNWQSNGVPDTWLCFAADFCFNDDFLWGGSGSYEMMFPRYVAVKQ